MNKVKIRWFDPRKYESAEKALKENGYCFDVVPQFQERDFKRQMELVADSIGKKIQFF